MRDFIVVVIRGKLEVIRKAHSVCPQLVFVSIHKAQQLIGISFQRVRSLRPILTKKYSQEVHKRITSLITTRLLVPKKQLPTLLNIL